MGLEIPSPSGPAEEEETNNSLQNRPSIFLVGPPNVGKRSILQRLLAMSASKDSPILSSGVTCHGWTINTKYYTADVCIWMARLSDNETDDSLKACALSAHCEALVMVFDLNNFSSFEALQEWVSKLELHKFEILLCVGNKADRVPDHFGHREYRRKLQKRGESSSDPHPEFWDYGIQQSDGSSLLGGEGEFLEERRRSCIEWCTEHGIEYIEACAVNDVFDQCISVDGDSQGLARIWGALSAHMWPGMIMKSQKKLSDTLPSPEAEEDSSDDESDFLIEYELLSNGSAEPWDGDEGPWSVYMESPVEVTVTDGMHEEASTVSTSSGERQQESTLQVQQGDVNSTHSATPEVGDGPANNHSIVVGEVLPQGDINSTLSATGEVGSGPFDNDPTVVEALSGMEGSVETPGRPENDGSGGDRPLENGTRQGGAHSFDDLEQLMQEMARMRENLRLMPDSHRREMAGRLAMQMASMFEEDE